jgi:sarcosine oxidase subunit gamma
MPDPVLPLGGARFDGAVKIEETLLGMIALRGDLSSPAVAEATRAVCGAAMPGQREASLAGESGLLWMSPDELLVLVPRAEAPDCARTLAERLSGEHALVQDMSDARAVFALAGDDARLRETLAKLAPADVSPAGLPAGMVRRTRLAQAPAAFWLVRPGEARVVCFRSVASYVFDLLSAAAAPRAEVGIW